MKLQYSPLFCFLLLLPVMQGCQPSYTLEQTQSYARIMGVTNGFEISRWHNRRILASQIVTVVADEVDKTNSSVLSETIATGLQPYFQRVDGGYTKKSIAAALHLAKKQGSDILFFVELDDPALKKDWPGNEAQRFRRLQLILTVADVQSGQTIDKIQLRAKSPFYSLIGQPLTSMLFKPVAFIGQDLSGQKL